MKEKKTSFVFRRFQDPPIIFLRPPKFVVIDFERKSTNPSIVRCIVDSFPRAKISWFHQGQLVAIGPQFHLGNITKRDQQGIYSYRIESEGFETINADFIIHVKGRPLVFIEESKDDRQAFECRVYSSTPILVRCFSKIKCSIRYFSSYRRRKSPGNSMMNQLNRSINRQSRRFVMKTVVHRNYSSIIENLLRLRRLYRLYFVLVKINSELNKVVCIKSIRILVKKILFHVGFSIENLCFHLDFSFVLISIIFCCFVLIVVCSIVVVYCFCRTKKRSKSLQTEMPIVFDEHYSINELIKEVGSLRTCTDSNETSTSFSPQLVDLSFCQMNL